MLRPSHASVTSALRRLANPPGDFDAARYFRADHRLLFYNVGTARMRALARDIYAANRAEWTVDDAIRLADALMRDAHLETKAVAVEVVARYRRSFAPRLLPRWKRWLAGNLASNWATTDHICGVLIGPLLAQYPRLIPSVCRWSAHRNMWVRRASAVALIVPMRHGLALDDAYSVAKSLHTDAADLIQKAVGWMLREAGKRDERRLERYLGREGAAIPRTTLRYAIERFPAGKRRELLVSTKPQGSNGGQTRVRRGSDEGQTPWHKLTTLRAFSVAKHAQGSDPRLTPV
jgi:3-methyladenine DNA glycosylase AlkD